VCSDPDAKDAPVRRSSTRSLAVTASAALALGLAACAPEDGAMTEDPATDGAPEGEADGMDEAF
jgi:hypothetical protein